MYRGIIFTLLILVLACSTQASCGSKVTFPDPNLEAAIREAIDKPEGDMLPSDLEGVGFLDASSSEITDINGLDPDFPYQTRDIGRH